MPPGLLKGRKFLNSVVRLILNSAYGSVKTWHIWWYVYIPTEALNFLAGLAGWYYFNIYASGGLKTDAFSFLAIGLLVNPLFSLAVGSPYRYIRGLYSGWASSYGYRISLRDYYKLADLSSIEYIVSNLVEDSMFLLVRFIAYLIVLLFVFKVDFAPSVNYWLLGLTVFLGFLSMLPLGLLVASTYTLYYNLPQVVINPFVWILTLSTSIVCGVYFPPAILPGPLRFISRLIPQTYAMEAIRSILLNGVGLEGISGQLKVLLLSSLLLFPSLIVYVRSMDAIDKKL